MASAGVAAGRQAEDALPPSAEPPLPETKSLLPPQAPPPVAAPQPQRSPAVRPQSPAGVKEEENFSFLPLVHNIIKWLPVDTLAQLLPVCIFKSQSTYTENESCAVLRTYTRHHS